MAKPKKNEIIKKIMSRQTTLDIYQKLQIQVKTKNEKVKITFQKNSSQNDQQNSSKKEDQTNPQDQSTINPLANILDSTQESVFPQYSENTSEYTLEYFISTYFDEQLLILILKSFFGYNVEIMKSYEEYEIDYSEEFTYIQRKTFYEQFQYYQLLFENYMFEYNSSNLSSKDPSEKNKSKDNFILINKIIDIYDIENNIYDYQDIFNNIQLKNNIIAVQFGNIYKCPKTWSNKSITAFPIFGQDSFSIVLQETNIVQIQVIYQNKLYVFSILSDYDQNSFQKKLPQKIDIIQPQDISLNITIKKYINTYYEFEQQFQQQHSKFMQNFEYFDLIKLSNTNYQIQFLSNILINIFTRYNVLIFQTISDSRELVEKYFYLCSNCGSFELLENQQTNLSVLQMFSPIYFGNSNISNYEKQLENMKKRPQVYKTSKKSKSGTSKEVPSELSSKDESKDESNDLFNQRFLQIQQDYQTSGLKLDINQNNSYITFYCGNQFPYINVSKIEPIFQPVYYLKCQLTPIKPSTQNIYKMYDVYQYFHIDKNIEEFLYNYIQGLIQIKPNLFSSYEDIIPGQYVVLSKELYNMFPNNLYLLRLLLCSNNPSDSSQNQSSNIDNVWLKSVSNSEIDTTKCIFYDIINKQYYVKQYQDIYTNIILIYNNMIFTLIHQLDNKIKGKIIGRSREATKIYYTLYNPEIEFNNEINQYYVSQPYNQDFIQIGQSIVPNQNKILCFDNPLAKDGLTEVQNNNEGTSLINQNKQLIGEQFYENIIYSKEYSKQYDPPLAFKNLPESLKQDPIHAWRAKEGIELIHQEPSLKELERIWQNWQLMPKSKQQLSEKKSIELFNMTNEEHYNQLKQLYPIKLSNIPNKEIDSKFNIQTLSQEELLNIIILNNKKLLIEELLDSIQTHKTEQLFKKLHLNISSQQQIDFYIRGQSIINYITTKITKTQAEEGYDILIKLCPNTQNLLENFIINQIYYSGYDCDTEFEQIQIISQYIISQSYAQYKFII